MDRNFVYDAALGQAIDILAPQVNAMSSVSKFAEALLALPASAAAGLGCIPSTPPALTVQVLPGQLYATETVDAVAFGDVGTNSNALLKQFVTWASKTLSCPAPTTTGFSINYLIEAQPAEVDGDLETLEYFNPAIATDPSAPAWSGPNNTGAQQPTTRKATLNITAKAGVPAAAGTQVTPAPDAGYFGLWVVTVTQGQLTITSGNISGYPGAVFIPNLFNLLPLSGGTMTGPLTAPAGFKTIVAGYVAAITLTDAQSGQFFEFAGGSPYNVTMPNDSGTYATRYTGVVTSGATITLVSSAHNFLINGVYAPSFSLPSNTYFDIIFDGAIWVGFACGPGIYATLSALSAVAAAAQPVILTMSSSIAASNGVNTTINTLTGASSAALSVASSAVIALVAGTYQINSSLSSQVTTSGAANPFDAMSISKNGVGIASNSATGAVGGATSNYGMTSSTSALVTLNIGDYITITGNTGCGSNFVSADFNAINFSMYRVGP
jgi:hypothetical protein